MGNANITCNKNSIPFDTEKPMVTSGIRLGTPAGTTAEVLEQASLLILAIGLPDVLEQLQINGIANNENAELEKLKIK